MMLALQLWCDNIQTRSVPPPPPPKKKTPVGISDKKTRCDSRKINADSELDKDVLGSRQVIAWKGRSRPPRNPPFAPCV